MATYNQVSYGSQGSDVTELQKLLNKNGYKLDEDGIFGAKTQAAVKDYQQKNNLTVDGIAGEKTWGALTNVSATPTATKSGPATGSVQPSSPTSTTGTYQAPDYNPGDTVTDAQKLLDEQLAQKPGDYKSTWQSQINDILQQILNREKFSYDLNGDALYQQYKDQYMTQGKMAMMDTMGQAQAMTGGYGNSYAQSVGQQAYQGHLQELNNKIPELYQLALNKYQMEGDALTDKYALLAQQEEQEYGRYRDQLGDWQDERNYLTDRYDTERDYDYNKWLDDRNFDYTKYLDNRDYQYQLDRDKITDEQWNKEFEEAKRQFDKQYEETSSSSGGGGGGGSTGGPTGGTGGGGGDYAENPGLTRDQILSIQKQAGIDQDGIWGPQTAAAYEKGIRPSTEEPAPARDYNWVVSQMDHYISSGAQKGEIQDFLVNARQAGYITQSQYNKLYKTYVPRGYTY